jgi:co-chaperonin GroES (HSP10)
MEINSLVKQMKPIATFVMVKDESVLCQRVLIKYSKEDIDKLKMTGRFHLPPSLVKRGEYCLEIGEVVKVSEGETQMKKGDRVITNYSLIAIDRSNDKKDLRDNDWLFEDEDGNEFACPTLYKFPVLPVFHKVYGIIRGKKIEPLDGTIFCEVPEAEEYKGKIIFQNKVNTESKSFKCKVKFISKADSEKTGIKKGDTVFAKKNSDIGININGESMIRIPLNFILGEEKMLQSAIKKWKLAKVD